MIVQFRLSKKFQRPVISMRFNGSIHYALLDTGALFPVFNGSRKLIESMGGVFLHDRGEFSVFGGVCRGDVYRLPLSFGFFRYPDLPVMRVTDPRMRFTFVLSAAMFGDFTYTIDNRRKLLTIDTGSADREMRLRVMNGMGVLHVLINEF